MKSGDLPNGLDFPPKHTITSLSFFVHGPVMVHCVYFSRYSDEESTCFVKNVIVR
jgi:hypothetical protein